MKTLRIVRNLSVLFILVMVFLVSRMHAATPVKGCVGAFKSGFNCSFDYATGVCKEVKCADPNNCADNRCAKFGFGF